MNKSNKTVMLLLAWMVLNQLIFTGGIGVPAVQAVSPCDQYIEFPGALPTNTAAYTPQGKLNKKLWFERGLLVYGCVFSFSGVNDFEPGTQPDPNAPTSYDPDGGYYSKEGESGEYRYHGYDKFGNKYINLQFRNDANSNKKLVDKQWIYHPWEELPDTVDSKPSDPGNVYGLLSPEAPDFQKLALNVRRSLGFQIKNGLKLNPPSLYFENDRNPLSFTLINQVPDTRTPGQATMWHKSASTGKIFYQSFSLEKQLSSEKYPTPVEAGYSIDESQPVHKTGKALQKVLTTVTGTLQDELLLSPADSFSHYTRKDIDYWMISVGNEPAQKINGVKNKGTAKFNVSVPLNMLTVDNKYLTVARTTVQYFNGDTAYDEVPVQIQFDAVVPGTQFNVNSPIGFTQHDDLIASLLDYEDASSGEFVKYELKIMHGTSQTFTYQTSIINDTAVNADLFSFIKSKFLPGVPPAISIVKTFVIEQKATTAAGGTSMYSRTVVVTQSSAAPVFIDPEPTIPDRWYDVVAFPASDATTGAASRTVVIDGIPVNAATFFNGQYIFGIGKHGLHEIVCTWKSPDGSEYMYSKWVVIYDTKPRVQLELSGIPKENRKLTAANTSVSANDPFVSDVYPLSYTFEFVTVEGDGSSLRTRTNTTMLKQFMYKKPGVYALRMTATNSLGRVSDEAITRFEIFKDEQPAIILHPFDTQVARGDKVRIHYDVVSTDGDQIASKYVKVYYDSNNDGTYDQLLQTYTGALTEYDTPSGKLGRFKLEAYAIESTTQETLSEFLDGSENKFKMAENYFEVENIQPSSDLYLDYPIAKPLVDVYFMLDASLDPTKTNYMLGNKITTTNQLINENTLPVVENWDMHTYTYSQGASTSMYSNTSYPPSSTYYSSGGYSGTLSLSSVGNSPTSVDNGQFVNTTSSQSFTYTWGPNIITTTNAGVCAPGYVCNSSLSPASWSINQDGYSGSIPKTGGYPTAAYKCGPGNLYNCTPWYATYAGTLSKTVQVWQPNWVTTNHYTGYYSGTIYQNLRQQYSNTFFRTISDKYIVYMADNTISQLSDLQNVVNNNTGKLILIGQNAMKSQIAYDHFILNNKTADLLVDDVIQYVVQSNPPTAQVVSLVGEPVSTLTAEVDFDNDPMGSSQMLVYQNPNHFDNSEGLMAGTANDYATSIWKTYSTPFTPTKPGKYTILRRIKDKPSTDPNFAGYAYWSNESQVDIIAHRKPIADVILDYDYDVNQNNYLTTWVDNSFDLDHNITRAATDKGIVSRTLSLVNQSTGVTLYAIPARLYPGTYTLTYAAKDLEGAWSDTITKSFTLSSTPPVQFNASAKTESSSFSLTSVPAGENLLAYNLWTRYPYSIYLQFNIGSITQTVPYYTGSKSGNDISWLDKSVTIPNTTTDGMYTFRIDAVGSGGGSAFKTFPVTVFTPINLAGILSDNNGNVIPNGSSGTPELVVGKTYQIQGTTTKYPSAVTVNVFKGSTYANIQTLIGTLNGSSKSWTKTYTIPSMAGGSYTLEWTATNPSGKTEKVSRTVNIVNNRPPVAGFTWSPPVVFEGDTISLVHGISDPDHDPLSVTYEITAHGGTKTTYNSSVVYPYTISGPAFVAMTSGNYTVKQTVNDNKSAVVVLTKMITVGALSITGTVSHTAQWEQNRLNYNLANPTSSRGSSMYFAGEKFMLSAATTDTMGSGTTANQVKVTLLGKGVEVNLSSSNHINWNGDMWQSSFNTLANGPYTFRFDTTYSNGVTKTDLVSVNILNNVFDYFQLHRID